MRKGLPSPCYKQKHWGSEWLSELVSHRPTAAVAVLGQHRWHRATHNSSSARSENTALSRLLRAHSILAAMIGPSTSDQGTEAGRPRRVPGVHGRGRQCWDPPGSPRPGTLSWSVQPVKGGQLLFICGKSRCLQQKTVLFLLFQFVWLFLFLPHRNA